MSGWVLDTNIISQLAPGKISPRQVAVHLSEWLQANTDSIFLSVVSAMEITTGIAKLRRNGAEARASDLDIWFGQIVSFYGDRILPVDMAVGRLAGLLVDQARAAGHHPGLPDILIAATANANGLGLLTDNLKHFEPLRLDMPLLNPLAAVKPIA